MRLVSSLIVLLSVLALTYASCPTPTIEQTLQRAWNNGQKEYALFNVEIKNNGDEALLYVEVKITGELNQFWELAEGESSGEYTLPEWRTQNGGLPAGQSHAFGFIAINPESVSITVSDFYCTVPTPEPELFQVSTLQALAAGLLQGVYTVGDLKKSGDFGLGTYEGYNGEMIILDRHVYHAYSNGSVLEAGDDETSPFAVIVPFVSQSSFNITSPLTQTELSTYITSIIPSDNYFYAIKIHGLFSTVTTRAIPLLYPPYPTLTEAQEVEVFFTKQNFTGTAVIIRTPQYASNLNAAGSHFHFISDSFDFGGHSTNLTLSEGVLEVQQIRNFKVWLPETEEFEQIELDA